MSDSIPLDNALAKLLFSDEGVRAWPWASPDFSAGLIMFRLFKPVVELIENRLEVRMSISAWVISSTIPR